MRKKDIMKINEELFSKNNKLLVQNEELKGEISRLKEEITQLTAQRDALNTKLNSTLPLKKLEEKITAQADISADTQYGSEIIGQIVISATRHCNSIAVEADRETSKELVNLILGRTEVAKAEILKIVSLELGIDEKKKLIDEQKQSAEDYFASVIAQIK